MTPRPGTRTAHRYQPRTWATKAACQGSSVEFLPDPSDLDSELAAKQICHTCAVRAHCLDDALRFKHPGIRGGLSEAQRYGMRRRSA